ncbi:hypothetical protein [Thermoflavimicrobium dichotomicum]|nr:hypothetical protein [Thermoflavimicrobium dichotomicum]
MPASIHGEESGVGKALEVVEKALKKANSLKGIQIYMDQFRELITPIGTQAESKFVMNMGYIDSKNYYYKEVGTSQELYSKNGQCINRFQKDPGYQTWHKLEGCFYELNEHPKVVLNRMKTYLGQVTATEEGNNYVLQLKLSDPGQVKRFQSFRVDPGSAEKFFYDEKIWVDKNTYEAKKVERLFQLTDFKLFEKLNVKVDIQREITEIPWPE